MIVLYTIDCPKCKVLEKKMNNLNLDFTKVTNKDEIMEVVNKTGITTAPILLVDKDYYSFSDAVKIIENIG